MNVGWLAPSRPDHHMRELRIHGVGTEHQPFKLNGQDATVVKHDEKSIRWALRLGGETIWTLEDREGLVPSMESHFDLPCLNHPHYLHTIHHQMERLSDTRRELKRITQKAASLANATVSMKPRTDALSSILDAIEKQLRGLHTQCQRKRKAEQLS